MLIADYALLGLGGAVSCFAALRWERERAGRSLVLSFIGGAVCGLAWCLDAGIRLGSGACLLFLASYMAVLLRHGAEQEKSLVDILAAVSLSCGCFGMLRVVAEALLGISYLSPFFRVMLALMAFLGVCAGLAYLSREFPEEGWQQYFCKEGTQDGDRPGRRALLFVAFGLCLSLPVLGKCSLPTAALALFAFFGGLRLFCLVAAASRERESLRTEKQYRDDMQTYMSVVRSQRHDYNFHVQTLHGLLLRKDYEACEKYLEELLQDSVAMNRLLPLKDAAVSALILSFQSRAQQEGIRLEITVENDLSQIATNVYETNKIIGNLLQNALDETERLPDRSFGIHLTILKRGEFCIINVANMTRQGDPMASYQAGASSKSGHEGIGIASIQALAARYGGVVYSRMEGQVIHFVAKIPLRLVKEAS